MHLQRREHFFRECGDLRIAGFHGRVAIGVKIFLVLHHNVGRELPIEAAYVGARVAVARDLSIVLNRHPDARLELTVEPAGSAQRE